MKRVSRLFVPSWMVLVCWTSTVSYAGTVSLAGKSFRLDWSPETGKCIMQETPSPRDFGQTDIYFSISDGKKNSGIRLEYAGTVLENRKCGLKVEIVPEIVACGIVLRTVLTNAGTHQMWLEPGLTATPRFSAPVTLWNGHDLFADVKTAVDRSYLDDSEGNTTFPMACIYGKTSGLALGLHPLDLTSYVASSFRPTVSGQGSLSFTSRVVLDPGQSETRRFVILHFPARYGFRKAIQCYQETFPTAFHVFPGVDTRINLPAGNPYSPNTDQPRRTFGGWAWCYAPFKRTGDMYGHDKYWDYTPNQPAKWFPPEKTAEMYHRERRTWFGRGDEYDMIMGFYNDLGWCEEQLAKQEYPDCLIEDHRVTMRRVGWTTGHDAELLVYFWGNRLGEVYQDDMKRVSDELRLRGFCYDCASPGSGRYRKAGMNASPGRAWDEQGLFVDQGIAFCQIMDYVHSNLKNAGRPLANIGGAGYVSFHSDAALAENGVFTGSSGDLDAVRYFWGQKPSLSLYDNYGKLAGLIDYENFTRQELREILRNLGRYSVLLALRLGTTMDYQLSMGMPEVMKSLPALTEVALAGWESVVPVSGERSLWIGRTGRGINTYLTFGNPTLKQIQGAIEIDQSELGTGDHLFTTFAGEPVTLHFTRGESRTVLRLPSHCWEVLKCRATVTPSGFIENATARATGGIARGVISLGIQASGRFHGVLRMRLDTDEKAKTVVVNGKETPFRQQTQIVETAVGFRKGKNTVEIRWNSALFTNGDEEINAFPFVEETGELEFGTSVRIVLPEHPTEAETLLAKRLQNYFYDWTRYRKRSSLQPDVNPEGIRIPIQTADAVTGLAKTVLIDVGGRNRLFREVFGREAMSICLEDQRKIMGVTGKDETEARLNMNSLMRILDQKYPYYGRIHNSNQTAADLLNKAGLQVPGVSEWPHLPEK